MRWIALFLLPAGLLAGCGGSGAASTHGTATQPAKSPPAFAWLHPAPPPPGWTVAHLPTATLAYPSSWQRVRADPRAASAARTDSRTGLIAEYLNATPQQGEETLQNWAAFRPAHNQEEGDTHVEVLAASPALRFRDGRASCVIDRYRTSRTAYQEIACLVRGARRTNVIVAAALATRWDQAAPTLERAVSAFVSD